MEMKESKTIKGSRGPNYYEAEIRLVQPGELGVIPLTGFAPGWMFRAVKAWNAGEREKFRAIVRVNADADYCSHLAERLGIENPKRMPLTEAYHETYREKYER